MNQDIIKGNWKQIKGLLKKHWGKMTDDEITQMQGSYEELEGFLQKKYGYHKEQAQHEIRNFLDRNGFPQ